MLPAENRVTQNRQKALEVQDEMEEMKWEERDEENDDEFSRELRRSMKTVEVIGAIIKNRAGSLGVDTLKSMFEAGMGVHLRHLTSFLRLVEKITETPNYSDF